MSATTIITAIVAFIAGLASEWFKQWAVSWFAAHNTRKAIQAEMKAVLIHLNFYILTAIDEGASYALEANYFGRPLSLQSFEYYWQNQRDTLLKIPEWSRLKNWNELLGQIASGPHPPLFNVIMLFESLTIAPLDKCLDRDSRVFARRVLTRPEVLEYKNKYFQKMIAVPL